MENVITTSAPNPAETLPLLDASPLNQWTYGDAGNVGTQKCALFFVIFSTSLTRYSDSRDSETPSFTT